MERKNGKWKGNRKKKYMVKKKMAYEKGKRKLKQLFLLFKKNRFNIQEYFSGINNVNLNEERRCGFCLNVVDTI